MEARLARCSPELLPGYIALADHAFVAKKGRSRSLAASFPNLFLAENIGNIFVAQHSGTVVGGLVARPFEWFGDGRSWRGAMLGMVCVESTMRGKGIGSLLVRGVMDELGSSGFDFAVLWTSIQPFYTKLGWLASDSGLFGLAKLNNGPQGSGEVTRSPCAGMDITPIERLRVRFLPQRVLRFQVDYKAIPGTVEDVECVAAGVGDNMRAYALVGRRGTTAYVYELVGAAPAFGSICGVIAKSYREVYINDRRDGDSRAWLDSNCEVRWEHQSMTLWHRLSEAASEARFEGWHVPFYDRI